jgi:hypothetical protein
MPKRAPKPKDSGTEQTEKQLAERKLDSLGSEFAVAQEWGLFPQNDGMPNQTAGEILASLKAAGDAIKADDFIAADASLLQGRAALNRVQSQRWYVANNRFGIIPIVFTAAGTLAIYWLLFVYLLHLSFSEATHHPVFWGLVGAVLKSLYWLQQKINRGLLRPRWFTYFIVAPFIGMILAAIATLLVRVGFRVANKSAAATPDWEILAVVAAFAAFNWQWALEKFEVGVGSIYSKFVEKKKATGS